MSPFRSPANDSKVCWQSKSVQLKLFVKLVSAVHTLAADTKMVPLMLTVTVLPRNSKSISVLTNSSMSEMLSQLICFGVRPASGTFDKSSSSVGTKASTNEMVTWLSRP